MKKKFICPVCGYVYEGEEMPEKCPICGKQMQEVKEDIKTWAAEHIVGVAKDAPEDAVTVPYYNTFNTQEELGQLTVIDNNEDNYNESY